MKKHFTIKSVLIALLVMISCTMKAETAKYTTDDGFAYSLDTETQEASLDKYSGGATEVVIPESVTYEGKEYKVTSLGVFCFSGCSSLTSIEIPSSVTSLVGVCFYGCSSLESIIVDATNPKYDSREGCSAIIETESNMMIAGCKNTKIPSSVTSLGDYCFNDCSSLTSIEIPSSVTSMGWACFGGCSSLTSIEIPSSVTSLGNDCFNDCSSLTSVKIPSSVTSLGIRCFSGCSSLTSIDIPSSVTSLGDYCFYGCSSLTSIEIPLSVTSLGSLCFKGCSSLTSIEIPSSVTSLGDYCFYGCSSLASIVIPSSVTSLGDCCFCDCPSLKTVICKMETVVKNGTLFERTPISDATLYVPKGKLAAYKSTDPWSGFRTRLPWTDELEVGVDETSELDIVLNTNNGNVVVSGLADGTQVSCYTVDGRMLGKASADGGTATFTADPNSVVIVKVGKKTFKVYVK